MKVSKTEWSLLVFSLAVFIYAMFFTTKKNDVESNAVMITNREMSHGGTGLIYHSTPSKSWILTNDHVCKLVKTGGFIITNKDKYQAYSVIEADQSDLCLVSVLDNLKGSTVISNNPPKMYDEVLISGFPALMPNIISKGHMSGRMVIPVNTGLKPCTDQDKEENPGMCAFLGGIPIIKYYESVLTSATIMPGNSGSGVYDKNKQLIGVVFAGQGTFGYSLIVPYEQVIDFLLIQAKKIPEVLVDQSFHTEAKNKSEYNEVLSKCQNERPKDTELLKICSLISNDMIWRK